MPYDQWYEQLSAIAQGAEDHPLYPLVSLFSSRREGDSPASPDPMELPFDCHNTITGLTHAPFTCPALDETLFVTYLNALKKAGGLMTPSASVSY
ncbi:MAG: hypothetical protein HC824_09790 [Synechococcales cyanobacterium RM1_1_8]|nr:hypothetical protein [Synechococcales cyanobacterium RM1_1_8]